MNTKLEKLIHKIVTYRTCLNWEFTDNPMEKELDKISLSANDCEVEVFYGNPACSPFIIIESENKKKLINVANTFIEFFDKTDGLSFTNL